MAPLPKNLVLWSGDVVLASSSAHTATSYVGRWQTGAYIDMTRFAPGAALTTRCTLQLVRPRPRASSARLSESTAEENYLVNEVNQTCSGPIYPK
jgi:hypothetical protein